jgi:hypothetical protein
LNSLPGIYQQTLASAGKADNQHIVNHIPLIEQDNGNRIMAVLIGLDIIIDAIRPQELKN